MSNDYSEDELDGNPVAPDNRVVGDNSEDEFDEPLAAADNGVSDNSLDELDENLNNGPVLATEEDVCPPLLRNLHLHLMGIVPLSAWSSRLFLGRGAQCQSGMLLFLLWTSP